MGERRSAQFLYLLCWGDCLICRQSGCTKMLNMSSSMQQLVNHVTQQALPASVSPCCSEPIEAWRRSRAAAAAGSEDWAPMLAWGSGANSTHSQHTANTQTTHNQHTTNTQPTHNQHTSNTQPPTRTARQQKSPHMPRASRNWRRPKPQRQASRVTPSLGRVWV